MTPWSFSLRRISVQRPLCQPILLKMKVLVIHLLTNYFISLNVVIISLGCIYSIGCFWVWVPWESLLTSNQHDHPLLCSGQKGWKLHHQIILMRGETAGSSHCSAAQLAQLVQIINPNHHLAKAFAYPPISLQAPWPDYLPHCGPLIRHYSTMTVYVITRHTHTNQHMQTHLLMYACVHTRTYTPTHTCKHKAEFSAICFAFFKRNS